MSRWIDADALVIDYYDDYETKDDIYTYAYVSEVQIDSAPSIDICFCRECKYHKNRIDYEKDYCIKHSKIIYNTDGYCSWGERTTSDEIQD